MNEAQIQSKIIKYLNGIGAYSVKTVATNRKGCPDVLVCLNGKFVGLEIKTDKGIISPLQKHNLELIEKSGGTGAVIRSVEDVKKILKEMEK